MSKIKNTAALTGLGAVLAFWYWYKNQNTASLPSNSSAGSSILDTLSAGISDIVNTLTGAKGNFVTQMTPIAQTIQAQYGIDPLITMTQAALESGWGTSGLTQKANNLYGYTGDTALNQWLTSQGLSTSTPMDQILNLDTSAAPFILMQTHESATTHAQYFTRPGDIISQTENSDGTYDLMVWRPFRRYDSWDSSVQDWATLMHEPRYASALADAQAGDLQAFANDVLAAGYATEPDYAVQLVSVGDELSGTGTA